ncbi:AfsR/SARP family transcriptional regulator [Actinoplanes derwentensis]|uniref:AfsR/SARP family transcriptional regulator n=1 Tax=Actinoplanes derwentensis TaxID=113562 RepID=UPI001E3856C8|nr:BTAD domain-containing putative transcriptional regulator [Actinoplanes derwentensis]
MSVRGDRGDALAVALFGGVRVDRGGSGIPIPGTRLRGLVTRLAVAGGRAVAPAVLVEALWPEDRPADPVNALQSLVSRFRRIAGADAVAQSEGGYRLVAGDVDVIRFERLAAAGRERLRGGDLAVAVQTLGEAAGLARGPVAAELADVAPAHAVRLARDVVEVGADLAEAEIGLGRGDRAAARLTGLVAEYPIDERFAGLLIDALAAQGRQGDALAVYERIRAGLADQLGADPGVALRERHVRLLRGDAPATTGSAGGNRPAPRTGRPPVLPRGDWPEAGGVAVPVKGDGGSAGVAPTNLPASLTRFVGREDDLARVDRLLAGGRLVTVTGPGGAGKTRLATEAAWRHAADHPDGTWLIDLASVTEPAKVGAAVVAAAGLRGSALFETGGRVRPEGRDDLDVLADRLSGRRILLVVDNCEHLIDAVAFLVSALLVRCPQLRVLATSREPLAVDGEALVPLGPLGLPEPDDASDRASASAAVRLFAERAAAVRPGFTVDDGTVRDVVRIVRALDGLPLALELAAARLRTLGLPELAAGLSDRFRLLTSGSRTAQPRHRTLRAVIAWSWDLLTDQERALAERVAVLPGGVAAGSAAAIGSGDVPELLAALVDRSILQLGPEAGRYRMLETLREYGIERLAEQGILDEVRDVAAGYLAALVAGYDARLRTADQVAALRAFRAEYDNVLAALRHYCDAGNARAAVALALDLTWYWQMFGRHADAWYWLRAALDTPGDIDVVSADCAEAVLMLNRTSTEPALMTETAQQRIDRLADLAARLSRHDELPGPAGAIASAALYFAGQDEDAGRRVDRLINGPDRWLAALANLFKAQIAENNGDLEQLSRHVSAALDGFRLIGDRWGQATALPLRALIRQFDGDLDGALDDLRSARAHAREFGSLDIADEIFIDLRWADLQMRRGDPDGARDAVAMARERAERSGSVEMTLLLDALEAGFLIWLGEYDRAQELVDRAAAGLGAEGTGMPMMGGDHGTAIVGNVRAALAIHRDDPETAEKALALAYAAAVETRDMPIVAMVAVTAGGLADLRGQHREAALLIGAAARLRGSHDHTDLHVTRIASRSRAALGEEGFGEAYAAGWSLEIAAAQSLIDPARLALPGS